MIPFMIRDTLREKSKREREPEQTGARVRNKLWGARGTVVKDLRPSGEVEIDGERFQAVATFGVLPKGSRVEVVDGDTLRLLVRSLDHADTTNRTTQHIAEANAGGPPS